MKTLLSALVLLTTFESYAKSYIHHETYQRLELTRINQDTQTAQYYDHTDGKYKTVNLSDVSSETNNVIDGVRSGNMALVKFTENTYRPCEVWHMYTNSLSHVGCQTGKINKEPLIERPFVGMYTASTDSMIKEVNALDGFQKKDKVRLMKDVGDLKKGDLVRIEHIFQSGSAMIQKMGLNLIDTSGLLMKWKVQVVELKDLSINK